MALYLWWCLEGSQNMGGLDTIFDDMPNVPGIGLTSQTDSDYPFLGIEWFVNYSLIAKNMFEADYPGGFTRLQNIERLEEGIRNRSDFGEIVKVNYSKVQSLAPLESSIIIDAYRFLANATLDYENVVKWLRIRVPEVMDLDTGEGWDNINNEEPGGTSDYWVMFVINNEFDYPYTEAEYVDKSHPYTIWGVLKPLWDDRNVRIQVRMFESDSGLRGSQHKDEEMDIRTGAGKDFVFEFDPRSMSYSISLGTKVWGIPAGFFIKSNGEGDLRARIYVKVWIMGDRKDELFYPVFYEDKNCDGFYFPVLNDIPDLSQVGFNDRVSSIYLPPSLWELEVYEDQNYKGSRLLVQSTFSDLHSREVKMGDKISSVRNLKYPRDLLEFPIFYENKNFSGAFLKLPYSLPNNAICGFYSELSQYKFNDRISSIKIPSGWKIIVYENTHFEGKEMEITSSISDLSSMGWNDRISSIRIIPPLSVISLKPVEGPIKIAENLAIINTVRESLKDFPEKYINSTFFYKRGDVKIPKDINIELDIKYLSIKSNYAYIEVEGKNYYFYLCILLSKENDFWRVKEIINPYYVLCSDKDESIDVHQWIYKKLNEKYFLLPRDIFPYLNPERRMLLSILREKLKNLISENTVFVVREYRAEGENITIRAYPRSLDGLSQYELVSAIFKREEEAWRLIKL